MNEFGQGVCFLDGVQKAITVTVKWHKCNAFVNSAMHTINVRV